MYNISFNLCAICIDCLVLVLFLTRKNYPSKANEAFLVFIVDCIIAVIFDNISAYSIPNAASVPLWLNYVINTIFYLSMNTILLWYNLYIMCIIYKVRKISSINFKILLVSAVIDIVLIVTNPLTHLVFYFDENYNYCSGKLRILVYFISIIILFSCLFESISHKKSLTKTQMQCVFFITIGNISSVVFQLFNPYILITSFTVSLAILVIYLSIQDADNFMDPLTRCFTHQAFEEVLNNYVKEKHPFTIITLRLDGFRKVNEMAGVAAGNKILEIVAQRLHLIVSKEHLYYNSGTQFNIFIPEEDQDKFENILSKVKTELGKDYEIGEMQIVLHPQSIVVRFPDHGKTAYELEDAIGYCLHQIEKKSIMDTVYADSLILKQVRRVTELDRIMRNALINGQFKIYYQPILQVETNEYHSAEALLRLYDDEYGFISPDEFIPRAEETGIITEIGAMVFDRVCHDITHYNFRSLGIDYIEINLSAVQCIQKNLKEQLFSTMKQYKVTPEMINLEITETATVASSNQLRDFMNSMIHDGILFSLDDYGSGLANINYLLNYSFKIVKLDKSLIWKAFASRRALIALRHTIEMLRDLHFEIVAEGVETDEQARELSAMGCDFFQGYLYSKAISCNEFLEFMNKQKRE